MQLNFAKQYQLENNIRALHYKNISIHEFYYVMIDIDSYRIDKIKDMCAYIDCREYQRLIQFLTSFHSDFKEFRGSILHYFPLSFVDSIVSELLVKEIHLQSYFEKGIISASNSFVLTVSSKSFSNHQNKPYTRVAFNDCSFYKQKGH
jgi:hypothetical protein